MEDVAVTIDQEALVLGIEDRLLDVVTGELPNSFLGVPKGDQQELRASFVDPPESEDSTITINLPVLGQTGLVQVVEIGIGIVRRRSAPPGTSDHETSVEGRTPVKHRLLVQCYRPVPHLSRPEYWCYTSGMRYPTASLSFAPDLPFKYVSGDPSIDLVNTVDWTSRGPEQDRLTNYQRLIEWAEGADVLPPRVAATLRGRARARPREAAVAHMAVLQARAVLWRMFGALARSESPGDALGDFNRLLAEALEHMRVLPGGEKRQRASRLQLGWDQLGESLESVLWPVIWSAASLLVSAESIRLRICGGPDCGWMYVDRSRNGLRRWCQMETCGSREKSRRRYQRG